MNKFTYLLFIVICFICQSAYCNDYYCGFTLFDEKSQKYSPSFITGNIDQKTQEMFQFYSMETWPSLREMTAQFYRKFPNGRYTNLLMTVIKVLREMQIFTFPPQIKSVMVFIITDGIENCLNGSAYTMALADVEKEIKKSAFNKVPIIVYVIEANKKYIDGPRPGLAELKALSGNNSAKHFKLPDFKDCNSQLNKLLNQVAETDGESACYFIIDRSKSLEGVDGDIEYAKDVIKNKVLEKIDNNTNEFALIPSGEFIMGSNDHDDDEAPAHKRMIETFSLGVFPVTEAQYYSVMGPPEKAAKYKNSKKPITKISWFDAINYCNRRSIIENKRQAYEILDDGSVFRVPDADGYYLPSEAQYQYAAHAGTSTLFHTGQTLIKEEINLTGELLDVGFELCKPNPWGIYEIIGSIRQWTEDFYDEYRADKGFNPSVKGSSRVCFGASFRDKDKPDRYRITYRFHHDPGYSDEFIGFRVAKNKEN